MNKLELMAMSAGNVTRGLPVEKGELFSWVLWIWVALIAVMLLVAAVKTITTVIAWLNAENQEEIPLGKNILKIWGWVVIAPVIVLVGIVVFVFVMNAVFFS